MDCSMPGFLVLHYLPEFAQIHGHWVGDVIQPPHPLLPSSDPALNLSQNQGLFQWVSSSPQVAKGLELQLQHQFFLLLFSHPVMSDSLRPHGLQCTRPPCPSPSPEVCPNSCPLHWWWHLILWCPLLLPSIFPNIRDFSSQSALHIRWPKYWSFSFSSPSNKYSGLISIKIDWFDLLAVQGTLRSLLQQFEGINSSVLHLLYSTAFITTCDLWEDHSLDYMTFVEE